MNAAVLETGRRSIFKGYDYSQAGACFTHGDIQQLNVFGNIIESTWHELPHHVSKIELRKLVVIFNHIYRMIVVA
jgi:hypothetical protein